MNGRDKLGVLRIVFFIILFAVFFIIPKDTVEKGSICVTYNLTGILCPGCGVTRAFSNVMNGDIAAAFNFNPLFITALLPIALFFIIEDIIVLGLRFAKKTKADSLFEYGLKFITKAADMK